jgi:hypothetical protein
MRSVILLHTCNSHEQAVFPRYMYPTMLTAIYPFHLSSVGFSGSMPCRGHGGMASFHPLHWSDANLVIAFERTPVVGEIVPQDSLRV